jgi:alpha-D-ribose 1-methylphosphonate 5-triphosphate synthase subunit PhnI
VLIEATAVTVAVCAPHPRTGATVRIAEVPISEAEVVTDAEVDGRPGFAVGYGATLGHVERRAIAIAILDGGLQAGGEGHAPESALLAGVDGLATSGFVEHLCLPHHASFASYVARVAAGEAAGEAPHEQEDDQ